MSTRAFTRFVFSPAATPDLPLLLESVGYNPNQEKIARPDGYPYYHWLQTAEGEGELTFGSGTVPLPPGSGMLLPPGMPHAYEAKRSSKWETYYLTFGGAAAGSILGAFGIREAALFRWEAEAPLTPLLGHLLNKLDSIQDLFGLETSTEVYRFLAVLSQFGQVSSSAVPRNMEKLGPLLAWMEREYGNPDVGLESLGGGGRDVGPASQQAVPANVRHRALQLPHPNAHPQSEGTFGQRTRRHRRRHRQQDGLPRCQPFRRDLSQAYGHDAPTVPPAALGTEFRLRQMGWRRMDAGRLYEKQYIFS
ncbi:hypothetical protein HMSSN139_55020 [Paenibacillus sp. HMSSN-139]|nr:hypothetical protein HMSSN139_55020 [Paenibacillus sp. HMSSN-139]